MYLGMYVMISFQEDNLAILSFFTLSRPYFYRKEATWHLCKSHNPSLLHLLLDCPAALPILTKHSIPTEAVYLRLFFLTRTSTELFALVTDLDTLLSTSTRTPP